jgi:hypothetical protein
MPIIIEILVFFGFVGAVIWAGIRNTSRAVVSGVKVKMQERETRLSGNGKHNNSWSPKSFTELQKKHVMCAFLYIAFFDTTEEEANEIIIDAQNGAPGHEWQYLEKLATVLNLSPLITHVEVFDNHMKFHGQKAIGECLQDLPVPAQNWFIDNAYKLVYSDGNMSIQERDILDDYCRFMDITSERLRFITQNQKG